MPVFFNYIYPLKLPKGEKLIVDVYEMGIVWNGWNLTGIRNTKKTKWI